MARGTVLVVDDNDSDIRLFRHAFRAKAPDVDVQAVNSGQAALDFLGRGPGFEDRPAVDLVLLDINMPGMTGFDVLDAIKANPRLRALPVVVYSTSTAHRDIETAYDRYASSYIAKPLDLFDLRRVVEHLSEFWFGVAQLPSVD